HGQDTRLPTRRRKPMMRREQQQLVRQVRNAVRRRGRRFLPLLEPLEGRWVPTTVTNLNDDGLGSLRQAILDTPAGGTVDFQPGLSGTITLTTDELAVVNNLTIAGPGADVITVSGNGTHRVLTIAASATVDISGLTISDGLVEESSVTGGGILNSGTLTLTACTVSHNSVFGHTMPPFDPGSGFGGGIRNDGTLTVVRSVITDNSARALSIRSGVYAQGGGIYSTGILIVVDSLMAQNSASSTGGPGAESSGGGIYSTGALTVLRSVIQNNTVPAMSGSQIGSFSLGGGIYNGGTADVSASTISGNSAP